jgi:hypothetical protein
MQTFRRRLLPACLLSALVVSACASPRPPPLDDQSRRTVPLPACVEPLPGRRSETVGTMRSLREEQVFKLLFPSFDQAKGLLPSDARACTGKNVLADPVLQGGVSPRGWPFKEQDGDIEFGSGGDRIKVAWLKLLAWPDGSVGGPIALVRANERYADLFALGALHGWNERTKIGTQRLGDDIVVTAEEDDCTGRKPDANCESHVAILLARGGTLKHAVDLASERVVHLPSTEKGATGTLEYRLTTSIDYKPDGIHLGEQIQVNDEAGRPLRRAEVERIYALEDRTGTLSTMDPPLWDRFVPEGSAKVPASSSVRDQPRHNPKPARHH